MTQPELKSRLSVSRVCTFLYVLASQPPSLPGSCLVVHLIFFLYLLRPDSGTPPQTNDFSFSSFTGEVYQTLPKILPPTRSKIHTRSLSLLDNPRQAKALTEVVGPALICLYFSLFRSPGLSISWHPSSSCLSTEVCPKRPTTGFTSRPLTSPQSPRTASLPARGGCVHLSS